MDRYQHIKQLLLQLETEMRAQSLWAQEQPPADALQSTEPFCVDRLSFFQWVQWVMIPRFNDLIAQQHPLPQNCAIAPMAEEALKLEQADSQELLRLFRELDGTLTILH